MSWLLGPFDRLVGTVTAACAGLAASQLQAFVAAYLQRLGGHLDEARLSLQRLQTGGFLPGVDAASRDRLVGAFAHRVEELSTAYDAVARADIFVRPIAFLTHVDRAIADATLASFTPALPLDTASIVYVLAGMAFGWLVYEVLKLPFRLALGRRRRWA